MTQSLEKLRTCETDYRIYVSGGSEHGAFVVIPPLSDEHHALLAGVPRLSWPKDFYLERGPESDSFWLGHDFNNGSAYGVHYKRAKYFAGVVAEIVRIRGATVSITNDNEFERASEQQLNEIQQANKRH